MRSGIGRPDWSLPVATDDDEKQEQENAYIDLTR